MQKHRFFSTNEIAQILARYVSQTTQTFIPDFALEVPQGFTGVTLTFDQSTWGEFKDSLRVDIPQEEIPSA